MITQMHINLIPVNSSGLDKLNEEINLAQTLCIHTIPYRFLAIKYCIWPNKKEILAIWQLPRSHTSSKCIHLSLTIRKKGFVNANHLIEQVVHLILIPASCICEHYFWKTSFSTLKFDTFSIYLGLKSVYDPILFSKHGYIQNLGYMICYESFIVTDFIQKFFRCSSYESISMYQFSLILTKTRKHKSSN